MILLYGMTVNSLPNLLSFTEITVPDYDEGKLHEVTGPIMDYDEQDDEYNEDYDDYDDYDNENSEDVETRQSGRLRQQLKSCEFIDLTALGPLCNSGRKIKYYKVGLVK